ncbi:MAG: response regulator [Bryobacteraceae bacterium]
MRILLVEDSPSDARLVQEAAKEVLLWVDIRVAQDGVEAMNWLHETELGREHGPDLILLDLHLPKKSGREVLAEIKGSPRLKQIPVIVMTSSQSAQDIADVYALNANSYIAKPADLGGFIHTIEAIKEFWFQTATLPDRHIFAEAERLQTASL